MSMRISGFKELERALKEELPRATAKNALWRAATNAMKRVEEGMAQKAPYDANDRDGDGNHLRDTMKTERVKATRQQGSVRFDSRNGVEVRTGPAPKGKRARANAGWQEHGTVKQAAHPYARPTADAEQANVIDDVRDELTVQIGKAKARIAKRALKGR